MLLRLVKLIRPIGELRYSTASQVLRTASVSKTDRTKGKPVRLFASVCVERLPVITSDMNDLEKRYSDLINEINIRKSYLSNHELRHLKDLERAKKKKETSEGELVIETALDYEEKCLRALKKMQFAERKLHNGLEKQRDDSKSFNNVDYILDKKLVLLINDPITSTWQLPYIEWAANDLTLRTTAERTMSTINENFLVDFMGNAPVGFYVDDSDPNTTNKFYFFKAQYKSGAQLLALSKIDFVWIRKDEMKDFIKNQNYLECLNNFILDF